MRTPTLIGVVQRRLLLNYSVDAELAGRLIPAPLRPRLVDGAAVGGICLIRLAELRPPGLPRRIGPRSENAAHRFAVEWDTPTGPAVGVYIPRRDTASVLNAAVGGRLFPGEHHRARFEVAESADEVRVGFTSLDGTTFARVHGQVTGELDSGLFASLAEASAFFEEGALGYSARRAGTRLDGIRLATARWHLDPLRIISATSSLFDDPVRFPPGTAILDSALLMRDLPVTWTPLAPMRAAS